MWLKNKLKASSSQQELKVVCIINELCQLNIPASQWVDNFKERLEGIKASNSFTASYFYRCNIISDTVITVDKLKADGDVRYTMYKLVKGANQPGPFDHI